MIRLMHGDTVEQMRTLPSESLDACVTDPPAGIAFMGRSWDHDKGGRRQWVAWMTEVFTEVYRVMKPGAHGLVWALPRTSHWTAWALEDAGFEVRDSIVHLFGSGFPKSLDVSKAIDKAAGAEREVVGVSATHTTKKMNSGAYNSNQDRESVSSLPLTAPATPEAAQWAGWGTALKPAAEIWWLIRKPLIGSVAANVLEHGTGALNIDAARITAQAGDYDHPGNTLGHRDDETSWRIQKRKVEPHAAGRWPANVVLSHEPECQEVGTRRVKGAPNWKPSEVRTGKREHYRMGLEYEPVGYADADGLETIPAFQCVESCAVRLLDEQAGERPSNACGPSDGFKSYEGYGKIGTTRSAGYADTGGPSRFFYTSKASAADRGTGNDWPTVKSTDLMRWLITLVTPPGGQLLDPFCGSGSTLVAADRLGFSATGIDSDAHALDIARRRLQEDAGMFSEVVG